MNEHDPLAQLRDIHAPDPLGWWPPAPGWWLLLALLVAGLALTGWLLYRRYRANGYRRAARRELEHSWARLQTSGDRDRYVHELSQILRRTALTAYPAAVVNTLHGEAWLRFLDQTSKVSGNDFSAGPGRDLMVLPYRPVPAGTDLLALHQLTMSWLNGHRHLQAAQLRAVLPALQNASQEGYRAAI